MAKYWPIRLFQHDNAASAAGSTVPTTSTDPDDDDDDFDRTRRALLTANEADGWKAELERYLSCPDLDVTRKTDTVEWWSVRCTLDFRRSSRLTKCYIYH